MKNDFEEELAKMTAVLAERDAQLAALMARADEVSAELRAVGDTAHSASFLGKLLYEQDEQYGIGEALCLEWTLDHFMARAFEAAYPWLLEIHEFLVKNGHGERNKALYYSDDNEAFFVRKDRPICVFGSSWRREPRYLWIDDMVKIGDMTWHHSYVRQIWQRTKLDCIGSVAEPVLRHYKENDFDMKFRKTPFRIYADARDRGHILTYEKMHRPKMSAPLGKCDKVIWDTSAPMRFLLEVNILHTQLLNPDG